MRYHYEPKMYKPAFGQLYICDHPVYNRCTLFLIGDKGLAVIQQRYHQRTKHTWWEQIDDCLVNDIYLQKGFKSYFDKRGGPCVKGLYPTVTVRQIMWALKMKPLKRQPWETCFDHCPV